MRLAIGATAALWIVCIGVLGAQAPAARVPLSDEVFKNVQLLKGLPVDQFLGTMGFFSSSTGLNCTDCHTSDSGGDWAKYADDTNLKRTTRRMITLMQMINENGFGGRQMVTCYTCHRGISSPVVMPSIDLLYAPPPSTEPGDPITQAPGPPTPESIIDKYIAAAGGAQNVSALTSVTGTGTYRGYDDSDDAPMEFAATSTGQLSESMHPAAGLVTIVTDGRAGWWSYPQTDRPLTLIALTGEELDGIKLQAQLFFPSQIKGALRNWRTGFKTDIDGQPVNVVQGNLGSMGVATLVFDVNTGLLVRMLRYGPSPVGRVVTRVDYSDYRVVGNSGVKIPHKWVVSWLDGRNIFTLKTAQANARIDAATFAKPAAR